MKNATSFLIAGIIAATVLLSSCQSTITRWSPPGTKERAEKSIELAKDQDIFEDYGWTYPPTAGRQLGFIGDEASISFATIPISIRQVDGDSLRMSYGKEQLTARPEVFNRDHYFDLSGLSLKTVYRSRLVTKQRQVMDRVAVSKTRSVPKTSQVYNSMSKSYQTQTTYVTEYYTDYENRYKSETYTEWETVAERVPDVPEFVGYRFKFMFDSFIVYQAGGRYYFQNAAYLHYTEKRPGLFGPVDVAVALLDADSNGSYTDPQDQSIRVVWNPYDPKARFNDLQDAVGNSWLPLKYLTAGQLLGYEIDDAQSILTIKNANETYLGQKGTGKLQVTGLKQKGMTLLVNGKKRPIDKSGSFSAAIQYGYHQVQVKNLGHQDYNTTIEINEQNKLENLNYQVTPRCATLVLKHHFQVWKIAAIDDEGKELLAFKENELALSPGHYQVTITGDGNSFRKEVTMGDEEIWVYDFVADSLTKR